MNDWSFRKLSDALDSLEYDFSLRYRGGSISQNTFHSFHKIHKEVMEVLFSTNWFDFHIGDKEHALSLSVRKLN